MKYDLLLEMQYCDTRILDSNANLIIGHEEIDALHIMTNDIGIEPGCMTIVEGEPDIYEKTYIRHSKNCSGAKVYLMISAFYREKNSRAGFIKAIINSEEGSYIASYYSDSKYLKYSYYDKLAYNTTKSHIADVQDEFNIDYIYSTIGILPDVEIEYWGEEIKKAPNMINAIKEELIKIKEPEKLKTR